MKKAQDSLAADLESCVAKRDDIDDKVTIREKKKNREMLAAQAFARKLRNIEAEVAKLEKVGIAYAYFHLISNSKEDYYVSTFKLSEFKNQRRRKFRFRKGKTKSRRGHEKS